LRSLCLILCSSFVFAHAMDGTLPRGRTLYRLAHMIADGDRYYNFLEDEVPITLAGGDADYEEILSTFEYLHGWTDDMSIVFRLEHLERQLETPTANLSNSGIATYYLALRQRLGGRSGSTRFMAETGVQGSDEGSDVLPLGSGDVDVHLIGSYNQDFVGGNGFELDIGYRYRGGDPADEIFVASALRFSILGAVDAALRYETFESQEEELREYDFLAYAPEQARQGFGVTLSRNIGRRWQIELGYRDDFRGRNTFQTSGAHLAFSWMP